MKCEICKKKLEPTESIFCDSCRTFIEWKYGSISDYLEQMEVLPDE